MTVREIIGKIERTVARFVPADVWGRIMRLAARSLVGRGRWCSTYTQRPRCARDLGTWSEPFAGAERTAVVMQGPIGSDGFAVETLGMYRRLFPGCRLILSTWDDAPLGKSEIPGVDLVLSERPSPAGVRNVNLQLAGTSAGIRRAMEHGCDWILKTRTDQRLYAPGLARFLIATASAFAPAVGYPQSHRIIGLGSGTLKYGLYCFTDQSQFGSAKDMARYWSAPYRVEPMPADYRHTVRQSCVHNAPETYLAVRFLVSLGRPVLWTLSDSWQAFADHFAVVDEETVDFHWPKYAGPIETNRTYDAIRNDVNLSYTDWLWMYVNREQLPDMTPFENCLDRPYGATCGFRANENAVTSG